MLFRDLLKDALQHGEHLDIAVIVHRGLPIGCEVKRVDEVEVPDVGRGRLIGNVDWVLQGKVPDGKRLELGVARVPTALVLVVQLREARGQFAAARPRPVITTIGRSVSMHGFAP